MKSKSVYDEQLYSPFSHRRTGKCSQSPIIWHILPGHKLSFRSVKGAKLIVEEVPVQISTRGGSSVGSVSALQAAVP